MRCPKCGKDVEVNGLGPSNSPKLTWLLQTIYKWSCKLFHQASCLHDLHYHIYPYGKTRADREFLRDMLRAIKESDSNWLQRKWHRMTAHKFYLAVKYGGDISYRESQTDCLKQLNLNSRDL